MTDGKPKPGNKMGCDLSGMKCHVEDQEHLQEHFKKFSEMLGELFGENVWHTTVIRTESGKGFCFGNDSLNNTANILRETAKQVGDSGHLGPEQ